MAETGCLLECGIQILRDRTDLRDGCVATCAAVPGVASTADARSCLATQNALTAGYGGRLGCAALDAGKCTAGFGALQAPFKERHLIAGEFDVDVVIEGQGDGVLRGKVECATAD